MSTLINDLSVQDMILLASVFFSVVFGFSTGIKLGNKK